MCPKNVQVWIYVGVFSASHIKGQYVYYSGRYDLRHLHFKFPFKTTFNDISDILLELSFHFMTTFDLKPQFFWLNGWTCSTGSNAH